MEKRPVWVNVFIFVLPLVMGLELLCCAVVIPRMLRGEADFRQLYTAGYMVRTGTASMLYDYDYQFRLQNALIPPSSVAPPFIRPAFQAILFAPLSYLPYRLAYLAWTAVNVLLIPLSLYLLRHRFVELENIWKYFPALVLCSFFPLFLAITGGQDSILLLALLSGALAALDDDREFLAGTLVAFGLFKYQIVVPIALLFLVWKRWRFSLAFLCSAFALAIVSIALVGIHGIKDFCFAVVHIRFPIDYRLMSNLHALLVGVIGNSYKVTLLTIVLSALIWLAVATWSPVKHGAHAFAIAILTASLVSFYFFGHDWIVLVLPILLAMNIGMNTWMGWAALVVLLAPIYCILTGATHS